MFIGKKGGFEVKKLVLLFSYLLLFVSFVTVPCKFVEASNKITISSNGGTSHSGIYYIDDSGERKDVYMASYTSDGSDAYCLQPGRKGPSESGTSYYEDESFDVSNCDTDYTF